MRIAAYLVWFLNSALTTQTLLNLPVYVVNVTERLIETAVRKETYLYGAPNMGNISSYPSGPGGQQLVLKSLIAFGEENAVISNRTQADMKDLTNSLNLNETLQNIEDFTKLYEGHWQRSVPNGFHAGMLTNGSLDLQFSMERLSSSPFSIRRLRPTEPLPFAVDSSIVSKIAGEDLETLLSKGKLFFVDHSMQLTLQKTSRYSGACSAYFYISDQEGLLPLAIKTNTDFDLVYTPLDSDLDWTLAKIMMNSNEAFFNEVYHIAAAHAVQEIVHLAANRALSAFHPVMALLDVMMVGSYAPRAMGEMVLTNQGGIFDQFTGISGTGALEAIAIYYHFSGGRWSSNYFVNNLESRGLINCTWGPELAHYPFFQDATNIYNSLQSFMTAFVASYYSADSIVAFDNELQDWAAEGKSGIILDFPTSFETRADLVDTLTHFAYLTIVHNTLNGGDPVSVSASLPYHPASLHAPLPTEKGITDIMPWLPNITVAIGEIALFAKFNRPILESSSFLNIFNDTAFLSSTNDAVREAANSFQVQMKSTSDTMRKRIFDANGLWNGMPSIWNALDPLSMARSSAV